LALIGVVSAALTWYGIVLGARERRVRRSIPKRAA